MRDLDDIAITRPGFFTRPDYFDVLAELRTRAPVHQSEPGIWLLSRYDTIRAVSRDPQRFCSGKGVLINDPARAPGGFVPPGSILHMDPPDHSRYRKVVNREFTPRATSGYEEPVRRIARQVFDALPAGEAIDAVHAIAAPIPVLVIAELLGVGDATLEDFHRWSDAMIEIPDGLTPELQQAALELFMFLEGHIAERKATPRDDLVSMLAHADLAPDEIRLFCLSLLVAGNETTRHLISGGIQVLAEHPDQRAALAADPSRIPQAVEEMLRWVTPIQAFGRTATGPVDLDGHAIAEGDFVVMLYASANRDEATFGPTAGQFDIGRAIEPTHLAFGFGEHLCLGAALARLEARVVFEELLARFANYEVTGPPDRVVSTLVRGARHLPVVLR